MGTNIDAAAERRKKEIEKYFRKTPNSRELTIALVLLGAGAGAVLLALIFFASQPGFLAVLLLAGGGYSLFKGFERKREYDRKYKLAEPKLSDAEMDRRLRQDLIRIQERAMSRLGLTMDDIELFDEQWDPVADLDRGSPLLNQPERRPLLVFGPLVRRRSQSAVGEDGVWRFAGYQIMVICPISYQLGIYRCELDFLTGGLRLEETQEYHYMDVVAVSTTTSPVQELDLQPVDLRDNRDDEDEDKKIHFAKAVLREFQIVVSSGDRSTIVVGILDDEHPENEPLKLQASDIDKVIKSVRRMLREKKGGEARPSAPAIE